MRDNETDEQDGMVLIAIPTTSGQWITGATVVKRDSNGNTAVVRTPSGTLYCASQFVVL